MTRNARDLRALGATALPTRELLRVAGVPPDEAIAAEQALALVGAPRDAALTQLKSGPRLIAALELGRRAWMLPSPAGRRIRAPVDVAAVCAPRFVGDAPVQQALALDKRLTLARTADVPADPRAALTITLAAGCSRLVVAVNRRGARAVPTVEDAAHAERLERACSCVGVALIDMVLLGDDGFSSLLRLGLIRGGDARYR